MTKDVGHPFDTRVPPQALEVESAVLGAMMMDAEAVTAVTTILRPDDFYKPANRKIYEAMLELVDRGEPIDLATVRAELENRGTIEKCGGPAALIDIADSVLTSAYAASHAQVISQKATLRRLIEFSNRLGQNCHNGIGDPDNIWPSIDAELSRIKDRATPTRERERAVLLDMANIEEKDIEWLWYPYLPMARVSLLFGEGGFGKSTLSLHLAAIISRGWQFPGDDGRPGTEAREPGNVLIMAAEDGIEDTMKRRLRLADADFSPGRITLLTGFETRYGGKQKERAVSLQDVPQIEKVIEETKAKYVIVDPVQGYLGKGTEINEVNQIRELMTPIGQVAMRQQCTIMLIAHPRKAGGDPSRRILGSGDFWNFCRSVLMVSRDPDQEGSQDRFVLTHAKHTNSPPGPSLAYQLSDRGLLWCGVSKRTAGELANISDSGRHSKPKADGGAVQDFLAELLENGPKTSTEVAAAAKRSGFPQYKVKEAKDALGVIVYQDHSRWWWKLPTVESNPEPTEFPPITCNGNDSPFS